MGGSDEWREVLVVAVVVVVAGGGIVECGSGRRCWLKVARGDSGSSFSSIRTTVRKTFKTFPIFISTQQVQ